jgi:hypothetical protein
MADTLSTAVPHRAQHDVEQTRCFLKALDPNAIKFTFQCFWDDKERRDRKESPPREMSGLTHDFTADEVCAFVAKWNTAACPMGSFITINETALNGSRKEKDVRRVRAVFIDVDEDLDRVEWALRRFPLQPTAVVESSPGKTQVYWFVQGEFPLDEFKSVQKALIKHFGTDPNVVDLPRVMRLPGTLHRKGTPFVVRTKSLNDKRYTFEQITDALNQTAQNHPVVGSASKVSVPSSLQASGPQQTGIIQGPFLSHQPIPGVSDLSAGIQRIDRSAFDFEKARSAGRFLAEHGLLDTRIGWRDSWLFPLTDEAKRHPDLEPKIKQLFEEVCGYSEQHAAVRGVKGTEKWASGNDVQWTSALERPAQPGDRTIASTYNEAATHGWRWSSSTQQLVHQVLGNLTGNSLGSTPRTASHDPFGSGSHHNIAGSGYTASTAPAASYQRRSQPVSAMPQTLPKREWLHGVDTIRGAVSLLVAPGGRGKSAFLIGVTLACASGRQLMGQKIYGDPANKNRLNVLYINAEDQQREIDLRVHGAMVHHKLTANDLPGLYTAGVDRLPLSLLTQVGQAAQLNKADWQLLEAEIASVKADIVVIDPLVSVMGGANVNDNAAASVLMKRFVELAAKLKVGVVVAHHTAKSSDITSQNAAMGAASLTNLARIQLSLETLAEGNAAALGVPPAVHNSHFRVLQTKANMAQAQASDRWYRIVSVQVQNAQPPIYPQGDHVGVVEPFTPNPRASVLPPAALNAALNAIKNAQPPLSPSSRSPDYAVPAIQAAIAPHMSGGAASTAEGKAALDELMRAGRVVTRQVKVPRPGNGHYRRDGLEVVGANPTQAQSP